MRSSCVLVLSVLVFVFVAWGETHTFTTDTLIGCTNLVFEGDDLVVSGCTLTVDCAHSFTSLTVINGGTVTHTAGETAGMVLTITNSVLIESGSAFNVNAKGYPQDSGPGAGGMGEWTACGGAYGGRGGTSEFCSAAGEVYGSYVNPNELGSGGGTQTRGNVPGGAGGGYVRLIVQNELAVHGTISANGGLGVESGGGSGGSLCLTSGSLNGSGTIVANGGDVLSGGGGGGGRIAIHANSSGFTGDIFACGGAGGQYGGAGTALIRINGMIPGQLTVSNCMHSGAGTPLEGSVADHLTIEQLAQLCPRSPLIVGGDLNVQTSGWIQATRLHRLVLTTLGDLTIEGTSKINGDRCGYLHDDGPGKGVSTVWEAGGAGHGGNGCCNTLGGTSYGLLADPSYSFGSGGGSATRFSGSGADGGGAIRVTVGGELTVDGTISVNGGEGTARGGGSGGGMTILAPTLSGSGMIQANGNVSTFAGGCGAGGRIALYVCNFNFDSSHVQVIPGDPSHLPGYGTIWYASGDANSNAIPDGCDFASGISSDGNQNGIPDEVELVGGTTVVTIQYDVPSHQLVLRWPLIPGYNSYRVYGRHGTASEVLLDTVAGGIYDVTSLLEGGSGNDMWTFRVIGVQ
ncbi:hypothetical protein KKH27_01180 [bacterium]|nr:hypothetical protein [bacterium]MBU1984879.1 hypothetical protein [bacterium]